MPPSSKASSSGRARTRRSTSAAVPASRPRSRRTPATAFASAVRPPRAGVTGPSTIQCGVRPSRVRGRFLSIGTSPARTSEDLPAPDGPITASAPLGRLPSSGRPVARMSSSRPKKTDACSSWKAVSPGKGEDSAGPRVTPASSSSLSAVLFASAMDCGSSGSTDRVCRVSRVLRPRGTPLRNSTTSASGLRSRKTEISQRHHSVEDPSVVTTTRASAASRLRRSSSRQA
ncbi:hypothetical protein ADK37_03585 [Streptomyces resistomycificus]|uniref:Uncharacterized protein n=1 Tax=Streptomyces resistomycificus TaxID=67356 RepID=A0A0L8LY81_9ACTN|nr:hypothetical protein ADK37_03585 [Streptomyces resistomycificus]